MFHNNSIMYFILFRIKLINLYFDKYKADIYIKTLVLKMNKYQMHN